MSQTTKENTEYLLSELTDDNSSDEENLEISGESVESSEEGIRNKILLIKAEIEEIEKEILSKNKEELQRDWKMLEETLIQKTISLDLVDVSSIDRLRELRKSIILYTQQCFDLMDSKVK
ncbi:hypothetical protein JTB14_002651 [Gonioctena quinquepunctata]|nr:hypothetical protein JTB14_002651 [Gonioctena quinquepunctata]